MWCRTPDFANLFSHHASLTATFPQASISLLLSRLSATQNVVHVLLSLSWQAIPPLRRTLFACPQLAARLINQLQPSVIVFRLVRPGCVATMRLNQNES